MRAVVAEIKRAKAGLKPTETVVTQRNGIRFIENDGAVSLLPAARTCSRCGLLEIVCKCTLCADEKSEYIGNTFIISDIGVPVGKGAFSARSLPAGTVVLREIPIVWVPLGAPGDDDCSICGLDETFYHDESLCTLCSRASVAASCYGTSEKLLVAALQLYLRVQRHGQQQQQQRHVKSDAFASSLSDAMNLATPDSQVDTEWIKSHKKAFCDILQFDGGVCGESAVNDLIKCAHIINSNAHALNDGGSDCFGFGLFPMIAMLNHSCCNNCTFSAASDGRTMEVRTVKQVTKGEQLTLRYCNTYLPRAERQALLQRERFFECCCSRCEKSDCEEMLSGVACSTNECSGYFAFSADHKSANICSKCGSIASPERLAYVKKCIDDLTRLSAVTNKGNVETVNRSALAKALEGAVGVLHPNHYKIMCGTRLLLSIALKRADKTCGKSVDDRCAHADAIRYASSLISCLKSPICPPYSVETASIYICLGDLYSSVAQQAKIDGNTSDEAAGFLTKAEEAFQEAMRHQAVCLGKSHPATIHTEERLYRTKVSKQMAFERLQKNTRKKKSCQITHVPPTDGVSPVALSN